MAPISSNWYARLGDTKNYVVVEAQCYRGTELPVGHTFNLSVPWWLTWLQSRHDDKLLPMAAWHDLWLKQGMDRIEAAAKARIVARESGVSAQYSHLLFIGMWLWTTYD